METVDKPALQVMWASDVGGKVRVIYQKAFYTPKEVASILELNYETVLDYINKGMLVTKKPSANRFLIAHQDLLNYLNQ